MTEKEKLAARLLFGTQKAMRGGSDLAAQQAAKNTQIPYLKNMMSDDPEVLALTSNGVNRFVEQTGERIWADHAVGIFVNRCPNCGQVAKTPKAKQCRFCWHDWHDPQAS
jgi:hypothetical protein